MRLGPLGLCVALFLAATVAAPAHEFWIDPTDYQLAQGETARADLRVGQNFEGSAYAFIPRNFRRFDLSVDGALAPVKGRIGDRPALSVDATTEGLMIAVHETIDYSVVYDDFEKFAAFLEHKDATDLIEQHSARGLPDSGFTEAYSRYAKSLIAVGDGAGQDRAFGMEIEIVALQNPYTDDLGDGLAVQVIYRGTPRADAQVEIFDKAPSGEVTVTTTRTDADGIARVPVTAGHRYMLDSVVLRQPGPELAAQMDAVWESLWANLTFAVP